MHVSTILALAAFIFLGYSGWRKWVPFFCVPLILLAIVQMQTRGAFVGLVAGVPVALLFAPRNKRGWVVFYLILGALLFLRVANNDFWERMATIHTAEGQEMESSAASRIAIAEANWRMAKDHPMGVGHRGNDLLSPRYMPESLLTTKDGVQVRSAHDTVMAILVDHGIVGLVLIVVFHARIVATLLRLWSRAAQLSAETQALIGGLATALVIYWVNAQFANMTKAEVVIWIAAMAAALESRVAVRAGRPLPVAPGRGDGLPAKARPLHG
jgi:O-antigen ligase